MKTILFILSFIFVSFAVSAQIGYQKFKTDSLEKRRVAFHKYESLDSLKSKLFEAIANYNAPDSVLQKKYWMKVHQTKSYWMKKYCRYLDKTHDLEMDKGEKEHDFGIKNNFKP